MESHLSLLFAPVSSVFVLAGTTAIMLVSFPMTDVRRALPGIRFTLVPPSTADEKTRQSLTVGVKFFRRAALTAQAVGWIGVFFGTIVMLDKGVFSDPAVWQPGFRVCILTALYGVVIAYALCHPVSMKPSRRLEELGVENA